jgi:predicted methyltransferase
VSERPSGGVEHRPFETLKPYHDLANEIEQYTAQLGREAADGCRGLGWIALGGRSTVDADKVADTLEAISRNADALAEQVRELDNPRDIREVKYDE